MSMIRILGAALAMVLGFGAATGLQAQASGTATITLDGTTTTPRPKARPVAEAATVTVTGDDETPVDPELDPVEAAPVEGDAAEAATTSTDKTARDPSKGAVTNLPIPRYVTLKGNEGNARRGPSLTHRIDWVFTTAGMPLRITAEHENWRRVEDSEGMGGWVHYSLLSGTRAALITTALADFRDRPDLGAGVAFQAERGVIGKVLECQPDWCRLNVRGEKGWVPKDVLWGVDPGELVE